MPAATEFFAETIMIQPLDAPFNDALEDLRITGSVLVHETYAPPWAVDIPDETTLRQALDAGPDVRVLPFHLVLWGSVDLSHDGQAPIRLDADEVAICPSGAAHRMALGAGAAPVPLARILAMRESQSGPSAMTRPRPADGAELLCGVFLLRAAPLNPLLAALPPLLKVQTAGAQANPLLARAAEMLRLALADDGHGGFTASRLLEVFCAEAIRACRQNEAGRPNWFNALDDARIGRTIARIHERPGAPWSVAALAEGAAMSPSRFAARFREATGRSAMAYVAGWRMTVACRMLRDTDQDLAGVAGHVGYQDVAAFSRAFKALVGRSPARWRTEQKRRMGSR